MSALKSAVTVGVFVALFGGIPLDAETHAVVGSVRTTLPDGETIAMPGVSVTLTCGSQALLRNVSDEQGQFQFANVPVGSCSLVTDVQGFKSVSTAFESTGTERIDLPLSLELKAMYSGLMVMGPPLDVSSTSCRQQDSQRGECRRDAGTR